jgi:hypothetical protein
VIALEKEENFVGRDNFLKWQEYGFTKHLILCQEYLLQRSLARSLHSKCFQHASRQITNDRRTKLLAKAGVDSIILLFHSCRMGKS